MDKESFPAKKVRNAFVYAPLVLGFAVLIFMRMDPSYDRNLLLPGALILLAASCLLYSISPGAGEIPPEQEAMFIRVGIQYSPRLGRIANATIGLVLLAIGVGLLWT